MKQALTTRPHMGTKKIRAFLFLGVSLVLAFTTAGQNVEGMLGRLAKNPAEKIYIHYDKDYYVAGETFWFKAYLYSNGLPSTISNNFYLQLIDGDGKIIATKKYPVRG